MKHEDDRSMTTDEREFVERFRREYAPEPRTPNQRVALGQSLEARMQRPRMQWRSLAVAACTAAVALVLVVANGIGPFGTSTTPEVREDGALLLALAVEQSELDDGMLPPDFATLASLLDY